jgi:hypothetical protein
MGLLDSILLAPIKGVCFIGKKIHEMAMEELLDEENVREELKALYVLFETGKISSEEFEHREEELVDLIEEIMSYKEGKNA